MSEMAGLPERCPVCGAAVRSSVDWCTQCYAPLRPAAGEREPDGADGHLVGDDMTEAGDDAVAGTEVGAGAGIDTHGDQGADGAADASLGDSSHMATAGTAQARQEAERVAEQMLAQLAAEPDPVRSWAAKVEAAPGGKVGAIVMLAVAATLVLLAVMYLVGSLG